jgi:flagellar biosynthetic protein FlhB
MAEEQDKSQQTEEATPKRLDEAREKGQVPQSKEPSTAIAYLVAASLGVTGIGAFCMETLAKMMRDFLSGRVHLDATGQGMQQLMIMVGKIMGTVLMPIALPILVLGVLVSVLVSGPVFSLEPLKPSFDKLNVIAGLGRMFSTKSLSELVKSLLKIAVISLACSVVLVGLWPDTFRAIQESPIDIGRLAVAGSLKLTGLAAMLFTAIALLDVMYQRWEHGKSMRMAQKEIRDEHKESEGNPQVKARIRRLQMEMSRNRMMADVPKADVIITNPTHIAVALAYDPENPGAPRVLAKGKGKIAEKIRQIARDEGIPLQENKPLARSLYKHVKVGAEIPEQLYEAVAIILAEIFQMKATRRMGA